MTPTTDSLPFSVANGQVQVRIDAETIQARIKAMADEINQAYAGCEKLIVVAILKGSVIFLADLVRHLTMPCHIEFVRLASYGNNTESSGEVQPVDLTLPSLANEHVLIVEDIIDTGLTLHFFMDYLHSLHRTKSLKLATLLDKPSARTKNVPIDFVGFQVGAEFLIGYGLDYAGYYRNLPYIGVVTQPGS